MENETNILLSELVEAVSRPDWWAIGITAVNAVFVIVLTLWQLCLNKRQTKIQERQNELQAQQVKLQEQQNIIQGYEMHRMMFRFVHETTEFAETLLPMIHSSLLGYKSKPQNNCLEELKKAAYQMDMDFYDKFVDINIHLSVLDAFEYDDLICSIKSLIENLEDIISQGGIKEDVVVQQTEKDYGDEYYINSILSFLKDDFVEEYSSVLYEFVEVKNDLSRVFRDFLIYKIKEVSFNSTLE